MPIPLSDFDAVHAVAQSGLGERILRFLDASDKAYTATEVAAAMQGISGRYVQILAPEVREVLPVVQQFLDGAVQRGQLRSVTQAGHVTGPHVYYAKAATTTPR